MNSELVENTAPLQLDYLPPEFVDRERELSQLEEAVLEALETPCRNLHLYGERGQGKTHLTRHTLNQASQEVNTCYVPCQRCDTQYKALKQVYAAVTQEPVNTGHHTSTLQREIENRTQAAPLIVVFDDIEFALLNNGDSLLYTLSRLENQDNISIITTSSQYTELPVEERTKSSLQPELIEFSPYTGETVYQILGNRAQDSLTEQSLHREALTYIASATSNAALGLTWLKNAAQNTEDVVTEDTVRNLREDAYQDYVDHLLQSFSEHHRLLYQGIQELTKEQESEVIRAGQIYTRYQELCRTYSEDSLSNRRISDFLKHLELLQLIEAEYHYGGQKGKTREISNNLNTL